MANIRIQNRYRSVGEACNKATLKHGIIVITKSISKKHKIFLKKINLKNKIDNGKVHVLKLKLRFKRLLYAMS